MHFASRFAGARFCNNFFGQPAKLVGSIGHVCVVLAATNVFIRIAFSSLTKVSRKSLQVNSLGVMGGVLSDGASDICGWIVK